MTDSVKTLVEQATELWNRNEAILKRHKERDQKNCQCLLSAETLSDATRRLQLDFDPDNPPPSTEKLQAHCDEVTRLLAQFLDACRQAGLDKKLAQLDKAATLSWYRNAISHPPLDAIAIEYALSLLQANPRAQRQLRSMVWAAIHKPGLRDTWQWLAVLRDGLVGKQKVCFKGEFQPTATLSRRPADDRDKRLATARQPVSQLPSPGAEDPFAEFPCKQRKLVTALIGHKALAFADVNKAVYDANHISHRTLEQLVTRTNQRLTHGNFRLEIKRKFNTLRLVEA